MKVKKLIITGSEAHFKIPMRSKFQNTYKIPPISTVVGMLKTIYNEDINDFKIGYFIEYEDISKEILTLYKEVNLNTIGENSKKRHTMEPIYVENLYNVRLVIYHNIDDKVTLNEPLVLGKANYLANIRIEEVELEDKEGYGRMQYTPKNIGKGMIQRINTITKYNNIKGYYEYKTELVRENLEEFELESNYDKEEDINIYMWKWRDGDVS